MFHLREKTTGQTSGNKKKEEKGWGRWASPLRGRKGCPQPLQGPSGDGCVRTAHASALPMSPALASASEVACLVSESPT